jgi:2-polyprenyl-3-methyl-5-hydroxy-6-metoxy-1,4-benzoquinol methylase
MKALDRFLQRWRITMVKPYLAVGQRVLDVGSADGALFRQVPTLGQYVAVDPDLPESRQIGNAWFVKGYFPQDLPDGEPFDAITMLAVLEHFPAENHGTLAASCARLLKPGGHLLITVPSPLVDAILHVLEAVRLIDGMATEQHHGFEARQTPAIFEPAGLTLVCQKRFQLGLNNLYVFKKA